MVCIEAVGWVVEAQAQAVWVGVVVWVVVVEEVEVGVEEVEEVEEVAVV